MVIGTMAIAQSKTVEAFKKKYDSEVKVISLTGDIFKLISSMAALDEADEDAKVISRIAEGIKAMDILTISADESGFDDQSLDKMRNALKKENYDELMTVNEGGNRIYFLSQRGNGAELRNMLVLIREQNDFMLMNITGSLDMNDLAYLAKNHKNWN